MTTESARIRAKLSHPLIDGDSHIIEYAPVLMEHFKAVGGDEAVADFGNQTRGGRSAGWYQMDERRTTLPPHHACTLVGAADKKHLRPLHRHVAEALSQTHGRFWP